MNHYYKGYSVSLSHSENTWIVQIRGDKDFYQLDCVPENSEFLDAKKFAHEFIDLVLLNNK